MAAQTLDEFIDVALTNQDFWRGARRLAKVSPDVQPRLDAIGTPWRLLALTEDWCLDAVNTLPVVQRLVEMSPHLELRVLPRDANPDLMDTHMTGASRSIPVVMLLDEAGLEYGWWGPRPSQLQQWYLEVGRAMEKGAKNLSVRQWYARDRGASTVAEILSLIERGEDLRSRGSTGVPPTE